MVVTYKNTSETGVGMFSTFASDLRLNDFPPQLPTDMGNGQPFVRVDIQRDAEGDVLYALYRQQLGMIALKIFND